MKKQVMTFCALGLSLISFLVSLDRAQADEVHPPIGASDYALVLTPYVSRQVAESIQLGYLYDHFTSDGCVLSSATDGVMTCLLYNTCRSDQPVVCALSFNARVGLRLEDVAFLTPLPFSGSAPFLDPDGNRIFEVLKDFGWGSSSASVVQGK